MKLTGGKSNRAATATREKSGGGKAVAVVGGVIIAAAVAFTGVGFFARSGEKVFPNVRYGGVSLGGLTQTETANALRESGYDAALSNAVANVKLPSEDVISISAKDAGLFLSAEDAAESAYEYGRGDNLFADSVKFFKGLVGVKTELDVAAAETAELPVVREAVAEAVSKLNVALGNDTFTVNEDDISILKGSGRALADENAVYALTVDALHRAVTAGNTVVAEYDLPEMSGEDAIDLVAIYNTVNVAPVAAKYDAETKTVTESVTGVSFDMDRARTLINAAEAGETVRIPLIKTEPDVTSASLRELLFRDTMSERKTYIDGTSNRLTNITLAAAAVNGTILNPGEEFSYNGIVGERTTDKGYKTAGAYSGGRTVQEIGGGICQVSSTIYDCVLYADLEVTSRRNHQFVVSYLPVGNDATVNWGTTDFKFKNNTEYPLRIDTEVLDRNLTVKLIGTKTNTNYVKIESVTLSSKGFETVEIEDPTIEEGKQKVDTSGHNGVVVETYKYRYKEDGTLIDKTFVSKSTYNAQNRIILVPVGSLTTSEETPVFPEDPTVTETPSEPTDNPYATPTATPPGEENPEPTPTVPADATPDPEPTIPADLPVNEENIV
ncbi:MAG: VanW family protein [Oscillospiraceae bacterium]|jgi:vancomycin resistance protein YoaR|nr:VanW family protein [Oscillospiraceae bacterium]